MLILFLMIAVLAYLFIPLSRKMRYLLAIGRCVSSGRDFNDDQRLQAGAARDAYHRRVDLERMYGEAQ